MVNLDLSIAQQRQGLQPTGHPQRLVQLNNLGGSLFSRFQQAGAMADLDEAIVLYREFLQLLPPDHQYVSVAHNNLGATLSIRFENAGGLADLDESIVHQLEALRLRLPGHPSRSASLINLGSALSMRFHRVGSISDLNDAIDYRREALQILPAGHANRPTCMADVAFALHDRFRSQGTIADLEQALVYHSEALQLFPFGDGQSRSLDGLGAVLLSRFQRDGQSTDLEASVSCFTEALRLRPTGHPERFTSLNNLARTLLLQNDYASSLPDVDNAVLYCTEALQLISSGHKDRSTTLSNLGRAFTSRFRITRSAEDLDSALAQHRDALQLRPLGHPKRPSSLDDLGTTFLARFQANRSVPDVDEAIACYREGLGLPESSWSRRPAALGNLGDALLARFKATGSESDLEDAITCHREALDLRPPGHPDRPLSLQLLSVALSRRSDGDDSIADLNEVVSHCQEALQSLPLTHTDRPKSLNILGNALIKRFTQTGLIIDLDDAIDYHSQALLLCAGDHPRRSRTLRMLALALTRRFILTGTVADIDRAIDYHREELTLPSTGQSEQGVTLCCLGQALDKRFALKWVIPDLEEAIRCLRKALLILPEGHEYYPVSLGVLGNALANRFELMGSMTDLNEAVHHFSRILSLLPADDINRSDAHNNLGHVYMLYFGQSNEMKDLDHAVESFRAALELLPFSHPNRPGFLLNVANTLAVQAVYFAPLGSFDTYDQALSHYHEALQLIPTTHESRRNCLLGFGAAFFKRASVRRDKTSVVQQAKGNGAGLGDLFLSAAPTVAERSLASQDLHAAFKYWSEAKDLTPADHPAAPSLDYGFAHLYIARYDNAPEATEDDLSEAFRYFERSANASSASSRLLLQFAGKWVEVARIMHHPSLLAAYARSLYLLERCLITRPTIESQHSYLAEFKDIPPSLASDAAADAIQAGELEKAVEFLEQGRAIIWSKMTGYRAALEELREVDAALASEFERLSREIEDLSTSVPADVGEAKSLFPVSDMVSQKHAALHREFNALLEKIRRKEQFRTFLQPLPYSSLMDAARGGPVIVINVSQHRCDVIIVRYRDNPILVPLPSIFEERQSLLNEFRLAESSENNRPWMKLLTTLWNLVVQPVAEKLAEIGVESMSRIWWCPTSFLCGLPFHAAGPFKPKMKNFPDLFVSSYTTNLSSLVRAYSTTPVNDPKLLLVGQSDPSLPRVDLELASIQDLVSIPVNTLFDVDATRESVTKSLRGASWVHFACHGHQIADAPFRSHLSLHDGGLSILDIVHARLPSAQLAFLAACHSAEGNLDDGPDETVHLAASMQFCGFRGVIGTFWPMADVDGPDLAKDFYRYMFRKDEDGAVDFQDAAVGLNKAIREMRKRKGMTLKRWCGYVHFGT